MRKKDKNIFKMRRIISFILAIVLLAGIIPVFPKAEENIPVVDLNLSDVKMEVMPDTTDEISIALKIGKASNYSGKRIRIPAKIAGKKVVRLAQNFVNTDFFGLEDYQQDKYINFFPDISQAIYLKSIGIGAFNKIKDTNLVIKDCPELTSIDNYAFTVLHEYDRKKYLYKEN